MRRWNFNRYGLGLMLLMGGIGSLQAATYNLSLGQRPSCSTSWSVSGSTYRCVSNGRISLGNNDVVLANSPATLIADGGFNLRSGTVGSVASPIDLQSSYGSLDANGATVFGTVQASSGDIRFRNTSVDGDLFTGGVIDLTGGLVSGDVTSTSHGVTADGTLFKGAITALGNIGLTDSEVTGKVTSTSNNITTTGSDLFGGAQSNGNIRITGGNLSGDFHSTSNNLYLDRVTMTAGSLKAGTVQINDSTLGGATGVVNVDARNGSIDLINDSVVYGDLTAPDYADINVSDSSQVYGSCDPDSPGCTERPPLTCAFDNGLAGEYFSNNSLTPPSAFSRIDPEVDFNWLVGSPDVFGLGIDNFSIRWSGYLRAPTDRPFTIAVRSDDGVRLSVDDIRIINNWTNHSATLDSAPLNLDADQFYPLELEYYEAYGGARIELLWDITDDGRTNFTVIPSQYLVHCDSLLPTPTLEWRMDESSWNGSPGEVSDSSGNNNSGTGGGNVSTVAGFLCRGGEFDGVDDFIQAPSLYSALRGDATLSFWIRTTATGNDTPYLAPGVTGVEQSGGTDDIFWGWLDSRGHIGLSVGNDSSGKSRQAINDGVFHHVVLIRDAGSGRYRIYIDGKLDHAGTQARGLIGTRFESLGRVENTSGGPVYFEGQLDEVLVFGQVFDNRDVKLLYDLQRQGKEFDGSERDLSRCSPSPAFCISHTFQGSLDSSEWRVSGNDFIPRYRGNRLRLTDDKSNQSTAATLLQNFPGAGNRLEVEFDFYSFTDNDDPNADAADGIALVLSDAKQSPRPGGYGGSLGYAQNTVAGREGFLGGWLGVGLDIYGNYASATEGRQGGVGQRPDAVSVRGSGDGTSGYVYLGGTSANLSPSLLTGRNTGQRYRLIVDHSDRRRALVTVERDTNNDGIFERLIGPIDVLNNSSQAGIPEQILVTLTGSTGGSSANHEIDNLEICSSDTSTIEPDIHHFELVRQRTTGLTCEPLSMAVRACLDEQCSSQYAEPFDIRLRANGPSTSTASGTGLSSGEALNLSLSNEGRYAISVDRSSPAVINPPVCFYNNTRLPNCNIQMNKTGLRFFDPNDSAQQSLPLIDLVAGEAHSIAVQVVEANQSTAICQGIFAEGRSLSFDAGSRCSDPSQCLPNDRVTLEGTALPNPQDQIGGAERRAVQLTFNNQSTAIIDLMAPDVGLQPLLLDFEVADPDGAGAVTLIREQIDLRVRPDTLQLVNIEGTKTAPDSNQSVSQIVAADYFEIAGAPFELALQAFDGQSTPSATANFGRTDAKPEVTWSASLRAPNGGTEGSFNQLAQWTTDSANSSQLTTSASYSEVGVTAVSGQIEGYLHVDGVADVSVDVSERLLGRFVPQRLTVSQPTTLAKWGDRSYVYQGQPNTLSNLNLTLEALDYDGEPLANYDGPLFRFGPALNGAIVGPNDESLQAATTPNWQRQDADQGFDKEVQLSLAEVDLTWVRKDVPQAADVSHQLNSLRLNAAALTDSDGRCYDPDNNGECDGRDFNLSQLWLHYGRLNADVRASGTSAQVILPVWAEALSAVDNSAADPFSFTPLVADDHSDNTTLSGLTAEGVCRLDNAVTDCNAIAASAAGNLTGLTGGQGYFSVNGNGAIGVVGVRAQVPGWLGWDWDDNSGTAQHGPASTLYFGQYTGRPPLLFQGPGFR